MSVNKLTVECMIRLFNNLTFDDQKSFLNKLNLTNKHHINFNEPLKTQTKFYFYSGCDINDDIYSSYERVDYINKFLDNYYSNSVIVTSWKDLLVELINYDNNIAFINEIFGNDIVISNIATSYAYKEFISSGEYDNYIDFMHTKFLDNLSVEDEYYYESYDESHHRCRKYDYKLSYNQTIKFCNDYLILIKKLILHNKIKINHILEKIYNESYYNFNKYTTTFVIGNEISNKFIKRYFNNYTTQVKRGPLFGVKHPNDYG